MDFRKVATMTALALLGLSGTGAAAKNLQVLGPAHNVQEIDLFAADAQGAYIKSIPANALKYPLPVQKDANGGFIVRIEERVYYIGASDVITNKEYDVTVVCDNAFQVEQGAATRGIAGKGCQ